MESNRRNEQAELYKCLGGIVRERRKELGMSQEQLAKKSNVDRAFISNIERGSRRPSFGTIANIAKGLDIRYSKFIARCEKQAIARLTPPDNLLQFEERSESA